MIPHRVCAPSDDPIAPEPVRIVTAEGGDAEPLSVLHAAVFRRGWSAAEFARLLAAPNVIADRAMVGARLAGFVMSRAAADEAEVLSIAVAFPYRRRGLARMLLATNMRRLAAAGVHALFLEVDERNAPARRLYAASGFREVARRQSYYAEPGRDPGDALVLRRDLAEIDAPPDDAAAAVEIRPTVKRLLGLDPQRSWIIVNEANKFAWPGYDLRRAPGNPPRYAYGFLPPRLFNDVLKAFGNWHKTGKGRLAGR